MTTPQYMEKMEKELIKNFMETFYEKMGYYPVVLTNQGPKDNYLNILGLTLQEIAVYFEPFLPTVYGKKVKLSSRARVREIVELRQMFCTIARHMNFSLKTIGQFLGNRDHTTIIHNLRSFSNLMETDANYREKYNKLIKQIKEHDNSSTVVSNYKV